MSELEIHGDCDSRFAAVREAFEENFSERGDIGAAVAVTIDGEPVVDLWAGSADAAGTRAWERDTIVNLYSTGKGVLSLALHMLADRGLVDIEAPVASYWPEFAQGGKEGVTVRHVLGHRSGVVGARRLLPKEACYDWETMTAALAEAEPWWEPGTRHGYHVWTYGWIIGEIVRRVSGRRVGAFIREEIAEPLGIDFHIGLSASEQARVADVVPPSRSPLPEPDVTSIIAMAHNNPPWTFETANTTEWREAEIPAGNAHSDARGLARFYGALAGGGELDGVRLISSEAIEAARVLQSEGTDATIGVENRYALGFQLPSPALGDPRPETAFGHSGVGGSQAFADPGSGLGFAYVMNRIRGPGDVRASSLSEAAYRSIEAVA